MTMDPVPLREEHETPLAIERVAERWLAGGLRRSARGERGREVALLEWGRRLLANHFAKPPSAMHEWLARELDELHNVRGRKINVIGPRGSAKSTTATLAYVLRAALEGWEPYIWVVSDTRPQAQLHLENIKSELMENERLAEAYPESCGPGARWRAMFLELRSAVVIEALSTGQGIRGKRRKAARPTLIICDDLQNDSHISSAVERDASRRWFHGTLLHAGTGETNVVNLATALHREALAMELHGAPGWRSKRFASIRRWPTNMALWSEWEAIYCDTKSEVSAARARAFYDEHRRAMDEGAEVLWPEMEDLYALMQRRAESGRAAFEREKQGSPFDPERCEWPEEYFGDWIWFDAWPAGLELRVIALDPSKGGDARRGDYSAFALVGIDRDGIAHIEADLARSPTPRIVDDAVAHCRRFRPMAFGVEANQFQELLCAELGDAFRANGVHLAPAAIHNHANKAMRIRRLGPYLAQRRLRFFASSPGTRLLVDQLRDFPEGAHDDGPDALEMALRLAEEVWHGRGASDGLGDRLRVG